MQKFFLFYFFNRYSDILPTESPGNPPDDRAKKINPFGQKTPEKRRKFKEQSANSSQTAL